MTIMELTVGRILGWLNEKYLVHIDRTEYRKNSPWGVS